MVVLAGLAVIAGMPAGGEDGADFAGAVPAVEPMQPVSARVETTSIHKKTKGLTELELPPLDLIEASA